MAKQAGIIKLKGTIDDLSFYKTADGHIARLKGGVDGKRIANDPAFQRTRENGMEFGRAAQGGKLVRNSIQSLLQQAKDKRVVSRLTTALLAILKTDSTSVRGMRNLMEGDLNLLRGFEFNINSPLATTLKALYTTSFDRSTGALGLHLDSFIPAQQLIAPGGSTHFKLRSGGSVLDFTAADFVFGMEDSGLLPYTEVATAALDLDVSLPAASPLPVMQVLCVEFYQEVNGTMYPLHNGTYNAMCVVFVDQPA